MLRVLSWTLLALLLTPPVIPALFDEGDICCSCPYRPCCCCGSGSCPFPTQTGEATRSIGQVNLVDGCTPLEADLNQAQKAWLTISELSHRFYLPMLPVDSDLFFISACLAPEPLDPPPRFMLRT